MEYIAYKKLNTDLRDMKKLAKYSTYLCRGVCKKTVGQIGCCIRGSDDRYYIGLNHKLGDRVISAEESALILFLNSAEKHVKVRSLFVFCGNSSSHMPLLNTRHLFLPFLESTSTRIFIDNGKRVSKYQFDEIFSYYWE